MSRWSTTTNCDQSTSLPNRMAVTRPRGAGLRTVMPPVQANGHEVEPVEGLGDGSSDALHPLQAAFREAHGLQCGFCTPGVLMTLVPFLREHPNPDEREIREALSGNLCRCTGYQNIVAAVRLACGAPPSPRA